MKKLRLLILTALIVAALLAAIAPVAAISFYDIYNLEFAGDKNGDNLPDKWYVKGDVIRTCDHPYFPPASDPCAMVFLPSGGGAALWQRIDPNTLRWSVAEEAEIREIGRGWFAAKQMDWERAYYGVRLIYKDGTKVVVYDTIEGGTYPFGSGRGYQFFFAAFTHNAYQDMQNGLVAYHDYGIVTLPHDGYLAVDWLLPWILNI